MLERILVPLDGSARAEAILSQLRPILARRGTEVILLRSAFVPLSLAKIDTAKLQREEHAAAEAYLSSIEASGLSARRVVVDEPPAEAVLDVAARERATLIAMTTHGHTGLSRWVLGSVAEKVLRGSDLPILLVRSFRSSAGVVSPTGTEPISIGTILMPTDGSSCSLAIVPSVVELAKAFGALVRVVYVGMGVPGEDVITADAATELAASGVRVTVESITGDPASVLVDVAAAGDVDLIAMGTHGRSGVSRWMLGSVTERVLRHAPVPLLVVRSPREE